MNALLRCALFSFSCLGVVMVAPLHAQLAAEKNFNVPAGDAAATLPRFVEQSGEQLAYLVDNVRGENTHAVVGRFTARRALERMLAGTKLIASEDKSTGALMIGRKSAAPAPPKRREGETETKPAAPNDAGAADEMVTLPTFTVSSVQDKGYLPGNSVSGTRINTPIKDLPFSIHAFTPQFIADVGARELNDVAQYAPGVTSGARQIVNANASFMIRGFQQAPQINGFASPNASGTGGPYVDAVTIDRVEVVKGPASVLYGQVAPGGTVNYLTKRADAKPFAILSARIGSYNFRRGTIDLNQPLVTGTLLFRLNAAYENATAYVEPAGGRTAVVAPSVRWRISPRASLTIDYSDFRRRESPPVEFKPFTEIVAAAPTAGANAGVLGTAGVLQNALDLSDPGFLPYYPLARKFNLLGPHDWRHAHFQTVAAELDFKFSDRWIARANVSHNKGYNGFKQTGLTSVNVDVPAALTSQFPGSYAAAARAFATAILANPDVARTAPHAQLPRRQALRENVNRNTALQAELAGQFELAGWKVRPLFGAYYDGGKAFDRRRQTGTSGTYTIFTAPSAAARVAALPAWDFNHPNLFPIVTDTDFDPVALPLTTYTGVHSHTRAAYGIVNARNADGRLLVIAGARYNSSDAKITNFLTNPAVVSVTNPTFTPAYRAHRLTPQLAAGFKARPDVLLYAAYSESYVANTFLKAGDLPGKTAKPTTSKGGEIGMKTDLLDGRISTTIAVYQIDQKDRVISLNVPQTGGALGSFDFQGSVDRSKGIEAELTLSPTDHWQIYASVAEDDVRTIGVPPGLEIYLGGHPQSTAKTLANLWTRYSFAAGFLKGAWVGGGVNYTSRKAGMALNYAETLAPTTLVNLALGYEWKWEGRAMSVVVNGENITDVEYFPSIQDRGLPARVSLTVTTHF